MQIDLTIVSAIARLPLPLRRRVLRAAWRGAVAAGRVKGFGVAPLLVSTMRYPRRQAERMDREMVFHDWLASMEWLALLNRGVAQLRHDVARVAFDDEDLLVRLAEWKKPVLFAPLHMGCYALAFTQIMDRFFRGRRMLILRARDDREIETKVMQRVAETGCDMRFLKVADKADYVEAVRFARAGAVIVAFVDLPASYGGPIDVELLGQKATIAMGIDALARVAGATIVPICVSSTIHGDTVHVGRPFETAESGPAERRRVAQTLKRHIETSVAAHPLDWHMWTRFHEYLRDEPLGQTEAAE